MQRMGPKVVKPKKASEVLKKEENYGEELWKIKNDEGFRLANTMLMLTYKGHAEKNILMKELEDRLDEKGIDITFIRCAHETGESTGIDYDHTHVLLVTNKIITLKGKNACRFFDIEDAEQGTIHPNIKIISSKRHLDNAKRYLAKEDKDNEDLLNEGKMNFNAVKNARSLADAVESVAEKWSDVPGIISYKKLCAKDEQYLLGDWAPEAEWMQDILEMNTYDSNRRTVYWYIDKKGGAGKSSLADWMYFNFRDIDEEGTSTKRWLSVDELGGIKDAAEILQTEINNGWNCHGIIIDIDRQAVDHTSLYSNIERIKNGRALKYKWEGGRLSLTKIPHMIVLANWVPDVDKLSHDRWQIRKIKNGSPIKMDLNETRKEFKRQQRRKIKNSSVIMTESDDEDSENDE